MRAPPGHWACGGVAAVADRGRAGRGEEWSVMVGGDCSRNFGRSGQRHAMSWVGTLRSKVRLASTWARWSSISCTASASSPAASALTMAACSSLECSAALWVWYISVISAQREISSPSSCASTSLPMSSAMRTWKSPSSSVRPGTSSPDDSPLAPRPDDLCSAWMLGRGDFAHEGARHFGLQHAAHGKHLPRFVHRGRGHEGAARRLHRDQAVLRELKQVPGAPACARRQNGRRASARPACCQAAGGARRWPWSAPRR